MTSYCLKDTITYSDHDLHNDGNNNWYTTLCDVLIDMIYTWFSVVVHLTLLVLI